MKILYFGVHSHTGWGAEYWLNESFTRMGHQVHCYDYRERRRCWERHRRVKRELHAIEQQFQPDVIFVQRANNVPAATFHGLSTPLFFWSTEPIQLKNDVDKLLKSDIFSWVWVHSYSCIERINREFDHIRNRCTVMHNACPQELIDFSAPKTRFAIFNRNLSERRKQWLSPSRDMVEVISGKFGEAYFADLASADVAVNVHYSDRNLDDFESGIFEAMAKGCVVVSEKLNARTVKDLGMEGAIVEAASPGELHDCLAQMREKPDRLHQLRSAGASAIRNNTWDNRAAQFTAKFTELTSKITTTGAR